jgi:hypothetical protein
MFDRKTNLLSNVSQRKKRVVAKKQGDQMSL